MPVSDSPSCEIVWGKFNSHSITRKNADVIRPHLAGEVTENIVTVIELNGEHCVRESIDHATFNRDGIWILSSRPFFNRGGGWSSGARWFSILWLLRQMQPPCT